MKCYYCGAPAERHPYHPESVLDLWFREESDVAMFIMYKPVLCASCVLSNPRHVCAQCQSAVLQLVSDPSRTYDLIAGPGDSYA